MLTVPDTQTVRRINERNLAYQNGQLHLPEEWDFEPDPPWDAWMESEAAKLDKVEVVPTEFAEFAFTVPSSDKGNPGRVPFSFKGRRYLEPVYNESPQRLLLKCGRQTEKSTSLGNRSLSWMAIVPDFRVLYVSPSNIQTKTFSADRINEPINTSEVMKAYTSPELTNNVFLKKLLNRSQITLRYAYQNADRVRGLFADLIAIDEIQDVLTDNIPVIEECASHSIWRMFVYSGTPKSLDNTIEYLWIRYSTQNEWVVPCDRCGSNVNGGAGRFWNLLMEENIGPKGLMCANCHELIDPQHADAQWASMNADPNVETPYVGFRVSQLMVPWIEWPDILNKQQTYSRPKFYNEVLGLSADTGTRPLTRDDVRKNCNPENRGASRDRKVKDQWLKEVIRKYGGATRLYMGIDWGGTSEHSFTVLTIGGYRDGKFHLFYIHRFIGPEAETQYQIDTISRLINQANSRLVGADYGGGHWPNDQLVRTFGFRRVHKWQYSTIPEKFRWDNDLGRWLVNRTEVMSDIFAAIKRGDVFSFPNWQDFDDPYARDMLNIFSEFNEHRGTQEYKRAPDSPDDSFHSLLYCFLVACIENQRPDVFVPRKE